MHLEQTVSDRVSEISFEDQACYRAFLTDCRSAAVVCINPRQDRVTVVNPEHHFLFFADELADRVCCAVLTASLCNVSMSLVCLLMVVKRESKLPTRWRH